MSMELRRARRRQMLIFMLVFAAIVILMGRLYYWQVVRAAGLALRANQEHVQSLVLNAPRGIIYDAQGHILATNVVRDDVYIEPIQFSIDFQGSYQSDLTTLVQSLHSVLPSVSESQLYKEFGLSLQTLRIAIGITEQQSQRLQSMQLPDIFLEPRVWRTYPDGSLAAQVLGYVSPDNNQGYYGIEGQYNTLLAGKPGSFTSETDLYGNPLVVGSSAEQQPVSGANLTLTINSTIQYMIQQGLVKTIKQLGAQGGSVVVLNARTGAVVAMVGAPTFDPNQYSAYANQTGCLGSESVYFNPVLYCAYEPGSTMKAVTMSAALNQGLITPDTSFYDPGYINFSDAPTVYNWADAAYGTETMTQVLEHSANVGAAYVAHNILGPSRYYPYVAKFGFGQLTGINDGPEATGFYRIPGSPGWTMSDLTRQAFGQSIEASLLQVAMVYQTIANGGVMMQPYLVSSINNNGKVSITHPQIERRVISTKAAQALTGMLEMVAEKGLGQPTQVPGYTVAVKTGTATTQGISANQTEASVAGFIPASNPQFVILVKIDRPQATIYGGSAAGPLWQTIGQQLMWYYHVPPDAVS
ncbi:MAG TPA: penicillin-binding protein 2 [Ktedonobacteraceae bacterium]|nr:penicillin-binding protein 2 [Ktedonobacteraceae bacterium]